MFSTADSHEQLKNTGMDTTAATMHPAEEYLRNEQNPPVLYVRIYGERRKLFINRGGENVIGIIAKGKRKHGYIFSDWNSIEKIYYPSQEKEDEKDMDSNTRSSHALPRIPTTGSVRLQQQTLRSPCTKTVSPRERLLTESASDSPRLRSIAEAGTCSGSARP